LKQRKNQDANGQHEREGQVPARPPSQLLVRLVDSGWILN
jgi:hypothetical protein